MTLTIDFVDKPEAVRVISKDSLSGILAHTHREMSFPLNQIGKIIFCTGTAVLDFLGRDNPSTDDLEFPIPDDSGTPIDLVQEEQRQLIADTATASLASIRGGEGVWAVDRAEVFEKEDGGKRQVWLRASLAVDSGLHINRVAYQVTLFLGPEG